MSQTRQMEWTCPKCRARNARPIPEDTPDGKRIAVTCEACKASYDATAVVRSYPGRSPAVYGVAWV